MLAMNLRTAVAAGVIPGSHTVAPGWTVSDAYRAQTETILDAHRYIDQNDRVLARHGDEVDAVLPADQELEERGVNLQALARALTRGLKAQAFVNGLEMGLDCELLFLAVERRQVNMPALNRDLAAYGRADVAVLNEGLSHLTDIWAAKQTHRTRWGRMMHQHGACSCASVN